MVRVFWLSTKSLNSVKKPFFEKSGKICIFSGKCFIFGDFSVNLAVSDKFSG